MILLFLAALRALEEREDFGCTFSSVLLLSVYAKAARRRETVPDLVHIIPPKYKYFLSNLIAADVVYSEMTPSEKRPFNLGFGTDESERRESAEDTGFLYSNTFARRILEVIHSSLHTQTNPPESDYGAVNPNPVPPTAYRKDYPVSKGQAELATVVHNTCDTPLQLVSISEGSNALEQETEGGNNGIRDPSSSSAGLRAENYANCT